MITCPVDGWVGILGVDVGDQVTHRDRSPPWTTARASWWTSAYRSGSSVRSAPAPRSTARPRRSPSLELTGEVATIDSRVESDSRTLKVQRRSRIPVTSSAAAWPSRSSSRFPGEIFPAVDPLAIQWSADGAYRLDRPATAWRRVPVRIVQRNSDTVLVDATWRRQRVITEGVQRLRPGVPVASRSDPMPVAAGDDGLVR